VQIFRCLAYAMIVSSLVILACNPTRATEVDVTGIDEAYIGSTNLTMSPGDSAEMTLVMRIDGANYASTALHGLPQRSGVTVHWSSSDTAIASISSNGQLLARRPGRVVITGEGAGVRDTGTVWVRQQLPITTIAAGQAFCWGSSWHGDLGNGAARRFTATVAPTPVATSLRFSKLAMGDAHTCALEATSGNAHCWGAMQYAVGHPAGTLLPAPVTPARRFDSIAAGTDLTCAVATGQVYCWGTLGSHHAQQPQQMHGRAEQDRFNVVSAARGRACAVSNEGDIQCWSAFRGLGSDRASVPAVVSRPVGESGVLRFQSVSLGRGFSCAVASDATGWCWGSGAFGRLGTGRLIDELEPAQVAGGHSFSMISAGMEHACGVTLNGAVFCWGENHRGQLGNGLNYGHPSVPASAYRVSVPVLLAIQGVQFTTVSAAFGQHSCALSTGAVAYCWGNNDFGALGMGRHHSIHSVRGPLVHTVPQRVVFPQ
jgi:alpha-tubulin suppressor-like RCC1 family protein